MSSDYEDNKDHKDNIVYIGEGGHDKKSLKQSADYTMDWRMQIWHVDNGIAKMGI